METNPSENHKNVAALIHLSTFSKYFFPFGNFIVPLVLWSTNKEKPFVAEHGRQAINFQLSIFLYALIIGLVSLPFFIAFATDFIAWAEVIDHHVERFDWNNIQNLSGYLTLFFVAMVVLLGVLVFELYAVISATVHASRGEFYKYPVTIPFIKAAEPVLAHHQNQSKNEHAS